MDAKERTPLRIEQVALQTGLTRRTIRYYEEIGLLAPATRSSGNYRLFPPETVRRLRMICRFRSTLGLSLAQTKALVEAEEEIEEIRSTWKGVKSGRTKGARMDRAVALLVRQMQLIDEKLDALREVRAGLEARRDLVVKKRAELAPRAARRSNAPQERHRAHAAPRRGTGPKRQRRADG
jgi:DNA-binding transcriptional MerR regulator